MWHLVSFACCVCLLLPRPLASLSLTQQQLVGSSPPSVRSRTHLTMHQQLVSKAFQGRHGKAYLFADVWVDIESKSIGYWVCLGVYHSLFWAFITASSLSLPPQCECDQRSPRGPPADHWPTHGSRHFLPRLRAARGLVLCRLSGRDGPRCLPVLSITSMVDFLVESSTPIESAGRCCRGEPKVQGGQVHSGKIQDSEAGAALASLDLCVRKQSVTMFDVGFAIFIIPHLLAGEGDLPVERTINMRHGAPRISPIPPSQTRN